MRRLSIFQMVGSLLMMGAFATAGQSAAAQDATPAGPTAGCVPTTEEENAAIALR